MRRLALFIVAATFATLAGSASAAGSASRDLVYRGDSLLTENMREKPYWVLQAHCSGLFGATSNYMAANGETQEADAAKARGVSFFRAAVDRLMHDRKVARDVAIASVAKVVDKGRAEGDAALNQNGVRSGSQWNILRSACLDMDETYAGLRRR